MENIKSEQVEMQTEVLTRKVWVAPQLETIEFLDTSLAINPGGVYDGIYSANRSF